MKEHLVIPDPQTKPKVDISHFRWIAEYTCERRPDVVVHVGDHWDMPSLCEYDRGTQNRAFYAQSFQRDCEAGWRALDLFGNRLAREAGYQPKLIMCLGNHDGDRFNRLIGSDPRLEGALVPPWRHAEELGWEVVPYLVPRTIDGITYCHLFCRSSNGRPTSAKWGAPNARAQALREMRSCTAGHKPGLDVHIQATGGRPIRSVIAGSCYLHDMDYEGPQGNSDWRGILYKHEVNHGNYDLMEVSLSYLKRKFGVTNGKGNIARAGTAKKAR